MERRSIQAIVAGLDHARTRYLIVGGLAVVAHGLVRFTADIDIVLDPELQALRRALDAFAAMGYRPRAPVELAAFADAEQRSSWVRDKGLTVFSLFSPEHPATEIDLFVEPPFDFERTYARARRFEIESGLEATFIGLDDLLDLKRSAGRPRDLEDVVGLEALRPPGTFRD